MPTKVVKSAKVAKVAKPVEDVRLSMAEAAQALGMTEDFVLTLTLSGAKQPADQGGEVVEIDYAMDGDDIVFTRRGVERFLQRCPVADWATAPEVEKRLGVERARIALLVYTGVPVGDGTVVRLPVWLVGGREYVVRSELETFAEHFKASNERKAEREFRKRYTRPAKPAAQS